MQVSMWTYLKKETSLRLTRTLNIYKLLLLKSFITLNEFFMKLPFLKFKALLKISVKKENRAVGARIVITIGLTDKVGLCIVGKP